MHRLGQAPLQFSLIASDAKTMARRGRLVTRRGTVETPAFMPVGTQATVKTLHPDEVAATGARILLANTYHLMLRPGSDVIAAAGGLHRFMGWCGPTLTDSGGFQIFSLAHRARISDDGVTFQSHIDGSTHVLTPERSVALQIAFDSDIMMALDHVIALPAERREVAEAAARTARWLARCLAAHQQTQHQLPRQALFGICQGGTDPELRRVSAIMVASQEVDGCAVGGLSVGEPKLVMAAMLELTTPLLPRGKPRYLMGVGSPEDLWDGVARGIDLFDCVLPTRLARNGALFTAGGRVNIKARLFRDHHVPLESDCDCATCARFTAAYLHHLYRSGEILGLRLGSVHNLRFLARQMETMRSALERGNFSTSHAAFRDRYRVSGARHS